MKNKCPKCKEEYEGYPAISRIDNKTEICSICGEAEALIQYTAGYRKVEMKLDGLSELEKRMRESVIRTHERMIPYIEKINNKIKEEHSQKIKAGIQLKKQQEQKVAKK